jgi:hypothetical protein
MASAWVIPGTNDPLFPGGSGIENTILRSIPPGGPTAPRLFQNPGAPHPYLQDEILNKIYNNITTRSNVFAVWITVGFFNVIDDTTRPVKLGAEVGLDQNKNIRHRMFALVDRSNLTVAENLTFVYGPDVTAPGQTQLYIGQSGGPLPGPYGGTWNLQPGSSIVIDPGANQETVVVTSVTPASAGPPALPPSITANFLRRHGNGNTTLTTNIPSGVPNTAGVAATSGTTSAGTPWNIQPNKTFIIINAGQPNAERVLVTGVGPGVIQANFTQNHASGEPILIPITITIPGNPGPQDKFDPRDPVYAPLVPYFTIVQ